MKDLQHLVENLIYARRNSDFVLAAAAFFAGSVAILGFWDQWLMGMLVGIGFVLMIRFALFKKHRMLREPLLFATPAVSQRIDGVDWVMVRAMLGRGRQMKLDDIEAWVESEEGTRRPLRMAWTPKTVVGPWTMAMEHPHEGQRVHLRLVGREGTERHEEMSSWSVADIQPGKFTQVADWKGDRICGTTTGWDRVDSCGSS